MRIASRLRPVVARQQPAFASTPVAHRCFSVEADVNISRLPSPPGPGRWPIVGMLFDPEMKLLGKPETMRVLYEKYGPIMRFEVLGQKIVFVSDVHMAREVLRDNAAKFTNGDQFRKLFGWFFPNSVIVVEGAQWKRIRRVIQRAVQGTRIEDVLGPMSRVVDRADALLIRDSQSCDVHQLACNVTLDTFGFWAYDVDFNTMGGENPELLASCEAISAALAARRDQPFEWLWRLPTESNRVADRAMVFLRQYSAKLLKSRDAQELGRSESQKDLLSALVAASQAEEGTKNGMSDEEIVDNIGTIFFGAYDTTSATIAFTMHFLAENIHAQEVLVKELKEHDLGTISKSQLDNLKYLEMVCKEANRLRSTAYAFPRTAKEDVQVGGFRIDAGTTTIIDHTSLPAQDPELWGGQQDLRDFRPERWAETKPHPLASLPFGFGARRCPGSQLATMEHKFITASLVQRYAWRLDESRPMETISKLGLCPKNGCWLIPEERRAEAPRT